MNSVTVKNKRVRDNTSPKANMQIDDKTFQNIKKYADKSEEEITRRIKKLDREWDIERVLELNMSVLGLTGIVMSGLKGRRWLALPVTALGFMMQHSLQGWCPPVTLLRALKVRTRDEINHEKHALKALRGDYHNVSTPGEAFVVARQVES